MNRPTVSGSKKNHPKISRREIGLRILGTCLTGLDGETVKRLSQMVETSGKSGGKQIVVAVQAGGVISPTLQQIETSLFNLVAVRGEENCRLRGADRPFAPCQHKGFGTFTVNFYNVWGRKLSSKRV